jgi:hypothetical protein
VLKLLSLHESPETVDYRPETHLGKSQLPRRNQPFGFPQDLEDQVEVEAVAAASSDSVLDEERNF